MAQDPPSPLIWRDDGLPQSRLYGDVYFSSEDGLAETQAVFLAGCGLPERWAGRRRFTVGELGFGSGLNIAALLMLWRDHRPPDGRLHVFTVEAHPMGRDDAARALGRWPAIAPAAKALLDRWPGDAAGLHRIELADFGAVIDVAVLPVEAALAGWSGQADAWFLDGFSPALNPAMWSQEVLDLVARRTAPGGCAATFTVAGAVRRGLAAAGFTPEKKTGFGRKRERLEAAFAGESPVETSLRRVAVIGAGIAGASAARALRAEGAQVTVFDPAGPGGGASGNPAALMTPRLDAGETPAGRFYAQAFRHAQALYDDTPGAVIRRGALQLEAQDRDAGRFDRIAASRLFDTGAVKRLTAAETSDLAGEPLPRGGLWLEQARVIDPRAVLAAWIGPVERRRIVELAKADDGWRLIDDFGGQVGSYDAVVLAAGDAARPHLSLQPVRGQASFTTQASATPHAAPAMAFGGYVIPTRDGVLFGATHDRDQDKTDLRAEDDQRNLDQIARTLPQMAKRLAGTALAARAGVRITTRDRMPAAGAAAGQEGLFILTGFGSRGFCAAPLAAAHVAALIVGAPSPLPPDLAAVVDPARPSAAA